MKLDFNDITITPEIVTTINKRSIETNPHYSNGFLPLFTAPMDTVVNTNNSYHFLQNGINVVLSRTEKNKQMFVSFNSFGLDEFEKYILGDGVGYTISPYRILLDVANGHMSRILDLVKKYKKKFPDVETIFMVGNIANPLTYKYYCESGLVDYVRVGIGNGNGCLTTQQTGVGYPMASLIIECNEIKKQFENPPKIVADGGMKDYADIIKALALGADYVMIGSIFNKALESASDSYFWKFKLNKKWGKKLYGLGLPLHKEFRGMSTKKSQKLMGNTTFKTSEGVVKKQQVEYTLDQWVENFRDYFKSTLSYCDCRTPDEFIGKVAKSKVRSVHNTYFNIISQNSFNRFKK